MQTNIVSDYKNLLGRLSEIIEISGYRYDFIAKKLGMKSQNFSLKKQRGNWTVDEVEKLMKVVGNDDVEDYLDEQLHQSRLTDQSISSDEFEKIMKWS
jgi:hypothetical protein